MVKTTTNGKKKVGSDDAAPAASPVMMMVKEEPREEEALPEETTWDLVTVLDDSKEAERAINCRTCAATAVAIWQSTDDPNGLDLWPLCEPCQEKDFGGWPDDDKVDPPATTATITTTTTESKQEAGVVSMLEGAGTTDGTASEEIDGGKGITPTSNANDGSAVTETAEEDALDDAWDFKKILPVEEIKKFPIQCDEAECNLLAAVVWTSSKDPSEKWRGCLDCQNLHFGGWPNADELPVKHMTQEHKVFLLDKCSRHQDAKMPEFLESPAKRNGETALSNNTLVTPPPPNAGVFVTQQKKNGKGKKSKITPRPGGEAGLQQQQQSKKKKSAASSQYNKKQAGKIREWNEAAVRMGGPDARVIIDNATAKETIFKFLYDSCRPMNINMIYREMRAAIPSPILRNCLADMAFDNSVQFADDSDDDNEDDAAKKNKKKSSKKNHEDAEPYTGALLLKTTKGGANAHLYHVNYNIAKNGEGLNREEKNKLSSAVAAAEAEKMELERSIKSMETETVKLLSEPANEEAATLLKKGEAKLKNLNQELEALRKLTINEKHKQALQHRIDNMTKTWRQRKRLCTDFLVSMEENTDGTVSLKKCLAGNGQIEIDSDEAVAEGAKAYAKKKRTAPRGGLGGQKFAKKSKSSHSNSNVQAGIHASESFVAVLLNSNGLVQRVHVNDDEDAMDTTM